MTDPSAGVKSFAENTADLVLEAVYRQQRQLILEDIDTTDLRHFAQVVRSGALQCLRSLSVSQSGSEDESGVLDLVSSFDNTVCGGLKQLSLLFSGGGREAAESCVVNCGIGDAVIMRLAEVVQKGCLPALELLALSDCYITKSSDTLLIKALKSGAKKMKKLAIKTKRTSMAPGCMNLLQNQQTKKSLRSPSRSPSR